MIKKIQNSSGFTAVEFLIILGIISIMFVTLVPPYFSVKRHVVLDTEAQNIIMDLRGVREQAIVSQNGISHGVYFGPDSYTIFGGDWSAPSYTDVHEFDNGLRTLNGEGSVVSFERLTGSTGETYISIGFDDKSKFDIHVNSFGYISHS